MLKLLVVLFHVVCFWGPYGQSDTIEVASIYEAAEKSLSVFFVDVFVIDFTPENNFLGFVNERRLRFFPSVSPSKVVFDLTGRRGHYAAKGKLFRHWHSLHWIHKVDNISFISNNDVVSRSLPLFFGCE